MWQRLQFPAVVIVSSFRNQREFNGLPVTVTAVDRGEELDGTAAVAGLGVAKKINMIAFNTTMGLTQGVLPLIGFSYGAKNYRRMRQSVLFTGAVALIYTVSCTVCFRVFAPQLVRFFIDDAASVQYGTAFLRIIAFATPMAAFCYLAGTCFQATGKKAQSFVLSVLRKGVVDIPFMFAFRAAFGIMGILYATPFAEVVSITIAMFLLIRLFRSLEQA